MNEFIYADEGLITEGTADGLISYCRILGTLVHFKEFDRDLYAKPLLHLMAIVVNHDRDNLLRKYRINHTPFLVSAYIDDQLCLHFLEYNQELIELVYMMAHYANMICTEIGWCTHGYTMELSRV